MYRVAAIHDISGVGKCSLTAALPIISSFGLECCPIPTAVLSTHTGDINGFTFKDLTDSIEPYYLHWKSLGIKLDCIYSGYLGSINQVDIVCDLIDTFSDDNPFIVVDPAMADFGELYTGFNDEYVEEMKKLCKKADLIVPNITEACLLTGIEYREAPFTEEYISRLITALKIYSKRGIVLTGVSFEKDKTGCAVQVIDNNNNDKYTYIEADLIEGKYYGTGDIFASALVGGLMSGVDLNMAAYNATVFTSSAISQCHRNGSDPRFGVPFELYLDYLKKLTFNS